MAQAQATPEPPIDRPPWRPKWLPVPAVDPERTAGLSEAAVGVLGLILASGRAWVGESVLSADEAATGLLAALARSGWIERFGDAWTLTPLGAWRLGVDLIEWGKDEIPAWVALDLDPRIRLRPLRIAYPAGVVSGTGILETIPDPASYERYEAVETEWGNPIELFGQRLMKDKGPKGGKVRGKAKVRKAEARGRARAAREAKPAAAPRPVRPRPATLDAFDRAADVLAELRARDGRRNRKAKAPT